MKPPEQSSGSSRGPGMAGGSLMALSIVVGVIIGTFNRQPSIGFLGGLGVGLLLATLVWLLQRRG